MKLAFNSRHLSREPVALSHAVAQAIDNERSLIAVCLLSVVTSFPVHEEEGSGGETAERFHSYPIEEVGIVNNTNQLCPCKPNNTVITTTTTEQAVTSKCCCQFESTSTAHPISTKETPINNENPCCCQTNQEDDILTYQDHSYSSIVNWDATNFEYHSNVDDSFQKRQSEKIQSDGICPDGWAQYRESCYFIEMEKVVLAEAELRCYIKNSTLFVANSIEEWNVIRKLTPLNFYSWIGLVRFADAKHQEPSWQIIDGMDAKNMYV
uniref:C-type lectin domain-containing protein n=1 Tax=Heterorhabditis bacteriophora TaxID=37862 RepID=A0A1I7XMZ7_HETBA